MELKISLSEFYFVLLKISALYQFWFIWTKQFILYERDTSSTSNMHYVWIYISNVYSVENDIKSKSDG